MDTRGNHSRDLRASDGRRSVIRVAEAEDMPDERGVSSNR